MDNTRFVKTPHLPEGRTAELIMGEKYRTILAPALENLGISIIGIPKVPSVSNAVNGHADLAIVHLGNKKLFIAREYSTGHYGLVNFFTKAGCEIFWSDNILGSKYPFDCGLNICILGQRLIYNPKIIDPSLNKICGQYEQICVRQGYSKCSISIVDEKSVITSDHGIARALQKRDIDVLEIRPGFIALDGYDTGFIGGSTFKLSRDELAVTGRLDSHPDRLRIESFLMNHNVKPIYLTDIPIFDIGSAIQLTEYIV